MDTSWNWEKKTSSGKTNRDTVQERGKNCRTRIDCIVISSICKKHVHKNTNGSVKILKKKNSMCGEPSLTWQNGSPEWIRKKTNTSLAGERKEEEKRTNETQACANGPPQRQRALSARMTRWKKNVKNRKKKEERRLLTWSMTRIIKCADVWKCERRKKKPFVVSFLSWAALVQRVGPKGSRP